MFPTYVLPWVEVGAALTGSADSFVAAQYTQWACLIGLIAIAYFRGRLVDREWIAIMPFLALVFEAVPVLNLVPLVPTALHVTTIIVGFRSSDKSRESNSRHNSSYLELQAWPTKFGQDRKSTRLNSRP